jgi:hypothetical protein
MKDVILVQKKSTEFKNSFYASVFPNQNVIGAKSYLQKYGALIIILAE